MLQVLNLIVGIAILILLLCYPAYARLMGEIMARQLDEKNKKTGDEDVENNF